VRFEFVGLQELHRIGGYHGQAGTCGQRYGRVHAFLLQRLSGTLQLNVKALREPLLILARQPLRGINMATTSACPISPSSAPDSAMSPSLCPLNHSRRMQGRPRAGLGIGAREQLIEIEIALAVLAKQQPFGTALLRSAPFSSHSRCQDRLHAALSAFWKNLTATEQIGQIRQRDRRHARSGGA